MAEDVAHDVDVVSRFEQSRPELPPQIVEVQAGDAGRRARRAPELARAFARDPLADGVSEHVLGVR